MDDREAWLVATMTELAEAAGAEPGETGSAHRLTHRLADLLAPAGVALAVTDDAGLLTEAEASPGWAGELMSLQIRCDEGPCPDSHRTGRPVPNAVIAASGRRWPRFTPAALAAGAGVVSALPLRHRGRGIGVLCTAAPAGHTLAAADARLAQALGVIAAVAVAQERDLRRSVRAAEQLQHALDHRVLIEQAKGVVAARLDIAPDRSFELLRAHARRTSRALADVAGEIVRGELPALALVAGYAADGGQAGGHRPLHSSR
jgi:hypothetical protein